MVQGVPMPLRQLAVHDISLATLTFPPARPDFAAEWHENGMAAANH
jgi:hypothetical protein